MQRGDEGGWGLLILFCVLVFFMAMPYYVGWSSRDEQSRLAGLLVQKKNKSFRGRVFLYLKIAAYKSSPLSEGLSCCYELNQRATRAKKEEARDGQTT